MSGIAELLLNLGYKVTWGDYISGPPPGAYSKGGCGGDFLSSGGGQP